MCPLISQCPRGRPENPLAPQSQKMLKVINSYCYSVPKYSVLPLHYMLIVPELCRTHREVTTRDERAHIIFSQDKRGELSTHVCPRIKKHSIRALRTKTYGHASGNQTSDS